MHAFLQVVSVRLGLGVLLGAIVLPGALGCNLITDVDALRFEPCAPGFSEELTATDVQGSDGGSAFLDVCPEGEVLVGLRGGMSGSFISGISGICGAVRVSEAHPYTISITPGDAMPGVRGIMGSEQPTSEMCPPNEVVVGFEGSTALFDANNPRPVLFRISLVCAPLLAEGPPAAPSFTLGETTRTPSMGGSDDKGDAFDPVHCPGSQIARALQGRSGMLVDALALGCAEPSLACLGDRPSAEE